MSNHKLETWDRENIKITTQVPASSEQITQAILRLLLSIDARLEAIEKMR